MEELKSEATKLGLDFKGNISKAELTELVEDAKSLIANDSTEETKPKKIKVVVTPRDSEEVVGYVGFNGYTAQYKFDEEIEMPEDVVKFLKGKGSYVHDGKGERRWVSRYIIDKV